MIHEDHSAEMSRQLEAFVHESSCKCEICKIPQLKFIMFQIGCHYSRLLWMTNKGDISMRFNEFAFEKWQNVSDKLRRMKDCEFLTINKTEFAVFSIRWLFQCADTMIRLSYFEEVEEIYKEVELICIDSVPDNECFKQALHCRKEIVAHLLEHGLGDSNESENAELSFIGFKANRDKKKPKKCPSLIKRAVTAQALNPNQTDVIYIDSGEESTSKTPKKPKKTTKLQPPATPKLLPPATPKLQPPATPKLQPPATPKPKPQATVTIDLTSETPAKSSTRPTRRRMM